MEKSKILLSNGIKISMSVTTDLLHFLSPKRFWSVYLCYFFLFMHGLMSSTFIDAAFVRIDMPFHIYIRGLSYTSCAALFFLIWIAFAAVQSYLQQKNKLFIFISVHILLIVFLAGNVVEFGHLILWGTIR